MPWVRLVAKCVVHSRLRVHPHAHQLAIQAATMQTCHAAPRYAALCQLTPRHAASEHALHVMPCHVASSAVMSHQVTSRLATRVIRLP